MEWILIIVFFIVCAETYSMRKTLEKLTDELYELKHRIIEDVKNRNYLINELQEKEEECLKLKDRLNEMK